MDTVSTRTKQSAGKWRALALGVAAMALTLAVLDARATPPTPPARLVLPEQLVAPEVELQKAVIPIRIEISQPVRDIVVTATLQMLEPGRPEFEQSKPRPVFEQRFAGEKAIKRGLEVPIRMDKPGEARLDIRLRGRSGEKNGYSDRIVLYVIMKSDKRIFLLTPQEYQRRRDADKESRFKSEIERNPKHQPIRLLFDDTVKLSPAISRGVKAYPIPENRQLLVRPAEPAEFIRQHSVDSRSKSWASHDPLTIRGRLLFQDIDLVWKPLVNAAVYLWDEDTFGDEYLASAATGWDGRWSFSVNDDDGFLQDGRDIYYTFSLENSRFNVSSCSSGAYQWKSAVHDNLPDGTVLDFGDETASTNMDALRVFSTTNIAWNHASTTGGWDPGMVEVCFPGSSTMYNGKVNVAASDVDGPDSITHEYGHALMAHAYTDGDPSSGGAHGFGDCAQNKALSWSEGWATGFMLSVRPDGRYNWHEGDTGQGIESFSSTCGTIVGEQNEGWVAASLLDMFDSANDDNGGNTAFGRTGYSDHNTGSTVALSTMLHDTMVGSAHHNDMLAYWSSLSGELDTSRRGLGQEIMYYDYMTVLAPDACVATKVATRELKNPEEVLGGLRRFRDLTLKKWAGGHDWINMYYRNSPEIASVLLRNPKLVPDALQVMRHFADVGNIVASNKKYAAAMDENAEIIPDNVAKAIENVITGISGEASADLKQDIELVRREVAQLRGVRLQEFQERIAKEKEAAADKPLPAIQQGALTKASRKALADPKMQEILQRGLPRPPAR